MKLAQAGSKAACYSESSLKAVEMNLILRYATYSKAGKGYARLEGDQSNVSL